jgi:MFS family permease
VKTSLQTNIRLLTWFNFFSSLQFCRSIPILYFASVSGSYALAAGVLSARMVTSALAEIPTGVFSDMIGRKKAIALGTGCITTAVLFYAIGVSYWFLVIGAILDGLAGAFYSGNNDALLYDSLDEDGTASDYAAHYGTLNALNSVGALAASVSGSIIASRSFPAAMWLSAIPQAVCLLISLRLTEPKSRARRPRNVYAHLREALRQFKTNYRLRLLSLSSILGNGFGLAAYEFQAAAYNLVWPLWAIGLARAMGELFAAIGFRLSDKVIRRWGEGKVILANTYFSWLANIAGALFPSVLTPLVISSSVLLYGAGTTAAESLKQQAFADEQRATMASLNALASSLLNAAFAVLIGLFADRMGPFASLLVIALCFVSVIVCDWLLYRSLRQQCQIPDHWSIFRAR